MDGMNGEGAQNVYSWQRSYQDAMLELNPAELGAKVRRAVSELQLRSSELLLSREGEAFREWQAITDALNNLRAIEKFELNSAGEKNGQISGGETAA
jgi:hypothetical protein